MDYHPETPEVIQPKVNTLDLKHTILHYLVDHGEWVSNIVCFPSINRIVSFSDDQSIILWNMNDGTMESKETHSEKIFSGIKWIDDRKNNFVVLSCGTGGIIFSSRIFEGSEGKRIIKKESSFKIPIASGENSEDYLYKVRKISDENFIVLGALPFLRVFSFSEGRFQEVRKISLEGKIPRDIVNEDSHIFVSRKKKHRVFFAHVGYSKLWRGKPNLHVIEDVMNPNSELKGFILKEKVACIDSFIHPITEHEILVIGGLRLFDVENESIIFEIDNNKKFHYVVLCVNPFYFFCGGSSGNIQLFQNSLEDVNERKLIFQLKIHFDGIDDIKVFKEDKDNREMIVAVSSGDRKVSILKLSNLPLPIFQKKDPSDYWIDLDLRERLEYLVNEYIFQEDQQLFVSITQVKFLSFQNPLNLEYFSVLI